MTSTLTGINCGNDCVETLDYGTVMTLTAAAGTESQFTGWSGACSGTADCVVTLNQAQAVTATFSLNQYMLTTQLAGTGSGLITSTPAGIACENDCTELYSFGTVVTLTATANSDSLFTGWSGGCGGIGECVIAMDQAKNVTAAFTLRTHTVTASTAGAGSGVITSQPAGIDCGLTCTADYDHGTVITLTAAPAVGSTFAGWSGGCFGMENCVVTIDQAQAVTATFTLNSYELSTAVAGTGDGLILSNPAGIGCGVDCVELYPFGTVVTLTAAANSGSIFSGWSGACSGTDACQITVEQAQAVTATFTLLTHELTVSTAGVGKGTVASIPTGIDCGSQCAAVYDHNTLVTLTAAPDNGSTFVGWSGACSGVDSCVVTMDLAQAVTATFGIQRHDLLVTVAGTGSGSVTSDLVGIECGVACTAAFDHGTLVTLTAVLEAGSTFVGWTGACAGSDSCTVTMNQAQAVTATFDLIPASTPTYTLVVSLTGNGVGTVTSDPAGITCGMSCAAVYAENTAVTLTATPAAGSLFAGWGGACAAETSAVCTLTMDVAHTVTADFQVEQVANNSIYLPLITRP